MCCYYACYDWDLDKIYNPFIHDNIELDETL